MVPPGVPLSRSISVNTTGSETDESASPDRDEDAQPPGQPGTLAFGKPCKLDLRDGCYQIEYRPNRSVVSFVGTLRVDRKAPDSGPDNIIVSGDLYRQSRLVGPLVTSGAASEQSLAGAASTVSTVLPGILTRKPVIPVFARSKYHSYLRVTGITIPRVGTLGSPCQVTLMAEQYDYTQPPAGQFKGSFPTAPSRTVTMKLSPSTAPIPFSLTGGPYFKGRLLVGGVDKGSVTIAWVSKFFRRASVEIDVLAGAIAPTPVPDGSGGNEYFDTIFARTGWQLRVIQDQINVPVPAGVTPTNCWSSADLHNLMSTVQQATNIDNEWRIHLSVVPSKLGCGRGVMFDVIGTPRQGCASFSDDGYPVSDSSNFGVAANQKQRDIARAFLRSATHEITHTFNQIHQEIETNADNSIMTTTPSVADVLGSSTTGAPGVFPDQINLVHNATVRNHLNHMPDPVIRPGGWPFSSWFPTGSPQAADLHQFDSTELSLDVTCTTDHLALGQPVDVSWTLKNESSVPLLAPNDVSVEALFATVTVTDAEGRERPMRTFVVRCDHAKLTPLDPGESVTATTTLFWASAGFAFERPGRYHVQVVLAWSAQGIPVGVSGGVDVFVDYPISDADNRAAGLVLHPEVGKWVALGGGAYHLDEACRRLLALEDHGAAAGDAGPARVVQSFADLMPNRARAVKLYPALGGGGGDAADGGGRARRAGKKKPR
ncbi:hypothetical protein QTH97_32365 [Variovorax sp. J22R24]|uniref:hypothetical protein n=1 Tax=Variovorax gracilis TaxID=3053502 RepID=UPI0025774116|nr:hypothetical protein [Variovorax sp. J22R24]MDM0109653.1 hypothetical protein [Variovorax sp. J22R24]